MNTDLCQRLVALRRHHAGWLLLAARNGPLILASLKSLIDAHPGGISLEDAVAHLTELFAAHASDAEFEVESDPAVSARRELRLWLKRGLIVERDGQLMATDSLQRAFHFLDSLEDQPMTSTASRLATVQRAIEELDAHLSSSQHGREESLLRRIQALEVELAAVRSGDFEVLSGSMAEEGIREVYQLAMSLRSDFRRVEDSYREADRELRQRIISEQQHRGEIVDELLDGHEALVQTVEGQVFESFHQQLVIVAELQQMKQRLRSILNNENADRALERKQKAELRSLVPQLVEESERVIQARARSERDVRSFLKSGLANEQIRVGAILQELFQVALDVDWSAQSVRRMPGPLRPVAVSAANLPVVERLIFKEAAQNAPGDLDLSVTSADPADMDDEFWQAYRALDRRQLFEATLAHLRKSGEAVSIGSLARALPPEHDLETLAYWLAMAREVGIELDDETEVIDLPHMENSWIRYYVPSVSFSFQSVERLQPGNLE